MTYRHYIFIKKSKLLYFPDAALSYIYKLSNENIWGRSIPWNELFSSIHIYNTWLRTLPFLGSEISSQGLQISCHYSVENLYILNAASCYFQLLEPSTDQFKTLIRLFLFVTGVWAYNSPSHQAWNFYKHNQTNFEPSNTLFGLIWLQPYLKHIILSLHWDSNI